MSNDQIPLPEWWNDPDTSRWPPEAIAAFRILVTASLRRRAEEKKSEEPPAVAYTVKEAAAILRVGEDSVYRAIQDGRLKAFSLSRGQIRPRGLRIPSKHLLDFMNGDSDR